MIAPSFSLTATERVLPNMALDFTTASLDSRVTLTRAGNTATCVNSSGNIALVNADLPRFDFNPTTLACNGLLIEESRTNLLLNSLLNGTSLSTQLVTTTAAAHTLSFYGTGQIVLTGTSSATVVGTGAYPNRQTLTFTPTVGVLTLTVTGTVQYAQLEVGAFVTSFIPTAASQVTRTADVATMTGTNFTSWFNVSEGAFAAKVIFSSLAANFPILYSAANVANGSYYINTNKSGAGGTTVYSECSDVTAQATINNLTNAVAGSAFITTFAYKLNSFAAAGNGGAVSTDTSGTVPTNLDILYLGSRRGSLYLNGWVQKLSFWPQRITNAEVQAFSK